MRHALRKAEGSTVHRPAYRASPQRPAGVLVARMLEPQPAFDEFMASTRAYMLRQLGSRAVAFALRPHVTIREMGAVQDALRQCGYSPAEQLRFYRGLEQRVMDHPEMRESVVLAVNPVRPLRWFGRGRRTLGINLVEGTPTQRDRSIVDALIEEQLGVLPAPSLYEHVAIARVDLQKISPDVQRNPELLLPPGVVLPEEVTLGGLTMALVDRDGSAR